MNDTNSITVTVKFFASLRQYGPKKTRLELSEGNTVEFILKKFKIPKEYKNLIILINGKPHQKASNILENGDILSIFPKIAGG